MPGRQIEGRARVTEDSQSLADEEAEDGPPTVAGMSRTTKDEGRRRCTSWRLRRDVESLRLRQEEEGYPRNLVGGVLNVGGEREEGRKSTSTDSRSPSSLLLLFSPSRRSVFYEVETSIWHL